MWTIEGFLNGEFVVNCQTKNESEEFFEILKQHNVKWMSGRSLDEKNPFNVHREKICYSCQGFRLNYADIAYYESNLYTIIPYRQLSLPPTLQRQKKLLLKILIGG